MESNENNKFVFGGRDQVYFKAPFEQGQTAEPVAASFTKEFNGKKYTQELSCNYIIAAAKCVSDAEDELRTIRMGVTSDAELGNAIVTLIMSFLKTTDPVFAMDLLQTITTEGRKVIMETLAKAILGGKERQ